MIVRFDFFMLSLFFALLQFIGACGATAPLKNNDILVDIAWLASHQNDQHILIVDARSNSAYLEGHIPGAVNIPVTATYSPVPPTDRVGSVLHIGKLFSDAGVKHEDVVVVYDDSTYIDAGRVFWVFEVFKHQQVKLLNGGFLAWERSHSISKENIAPKPSNYVPVVEPARLITRFSMQLAITDETKLIIDARSPQEYNGKKSIASRFGHIPNAINVPWHKNFIEVDGLRMLKPVAELRVVYGDAKLGEKIYTYCNKGKHASLAYTILRQLGYDVAHYDGSWFEWGNDPSLPLE